MISKYFYNGIRYKSYFYVIYDKIKDDLDINENFKGTNTAERISAGSSILSFLNKKHHFVFVSTHNIELTELFKQNHYELYHFQEQIINYLLTTN